MSSEITKNKKEIHLIKLDIDGTSTNADFSTLNKNLKKALQKLKEQGHKICFTTGRNYLSALPFYKEVGLNTFLVTYNGAYINNPSDQNNQETVVLHPIKNEIVKDILSEPIIKKNLRNILIDRVDLKTISTSDDVYYQEIFFNGNPYTKGEDILQLLGKEDALQLVLEFPSFEVEAEKAFNEILATLHNKYGSSTAFYYGSKLKAESPGNKILVPDPKRKIIKIRSIFASKGRGTEWVANKYRIPLSRVIAFGNDDNDIELMHTAGHSVATSDSSPYLKRCASYRMTDYGLFNSEGVTKYLTDYFELK